MAGLVLVNNRKVDKPGVKVEETSSIRLLGEVSPYVSRGGLKLAKAIQSFGLDLTEKKVLDVGASTGGFTDCALKHGAERVWAVDVGYGQLAWELRQNPRVICMERINIRELQPEQLPVKMDYITIDVSFISLTKVLPVVIGFLQPDGQIIALVKPQFEAGRSEVGKKGVVKEAKVHRAVLENIIQYAAGLGFDTAGLTHSPILGPEGNIEFLLHLVRGMLRADYLRLIDDTVACAHLDMSK